MTWQGLDSGQVALLKAFQSGNPLPFRVRLRGYDRRQVDEFLREIAGLIGTKSPPPIERPTFTIVFRGYDPRDVNEFLAPLFETSTD